MDFRRPTPSRSASGPGAAAMSLPTRSNRFSYSFDDPLSAYRAGYVSPDPTPSIPDFYPAPNTHGARGQGQAHAQSLTAPRGYPAGPGSELFTNTELIAPGRRRQGHGHGPGQGVRGGGEYTSLYDDGYGGGGGRRSGRGEDDVAGEMDPFFVPALPARKEEKKGKKIRKAPEIKQPTFLTKLYGILEQQEYNHIIRWDQEGAIIIIERPGELATKVLPLVYRQSRFASFSRQLNIYGFMRKVSLRHIEETISDPDASTWSHSTLRRDSPIDEILNFKRRVGPRPSQAKRRASVPEQMLSPTESDVSDSGDAYLPNLLDGADVIAPMPSPLFHAESLYETPPLGGYAALGGVSPDSDYLPQPDYLPQGEQQQAQQQTQQEQGQQQWVPSYQSYNSYNANPGPIIHPNFSSTFTSTAQQHTYAYTPCMPQSAPVHMYSNGKAYDVQVFQGHLRTRSIQAEPPSAAIWTPAPYGSNSYGALPTSLSVAYPTSVANSFGTGTATGTAMPNNNGGDNNGNASLGGNGNTIQQGWVNCYTNEPISPPPNSLGMIGARMATTSTFDGPASVPTSFSPLSASAGANSGSAGLGEPFQYRPAAYPRHHSLSGSAESNPSYPPATVSPGIYQSGFTPPVNVLTRSVSSPRPAYSPSPATSIAVPAPSTSPRQVRRQSISSTPYSPTQRSRPPLSLAQLSMSPRNFGLGLSYGHGHSHGALRGLGGMSGSGSDGGGYKSSTMGTPEMVIPELPVGRVVVVGDKHDGEGDEGLPSAGLMAGLGISGVDGGSPFGGILFKGEEYADEEGC